MKKAVMGDARGREINFVCGQNCSQKSVNRLILKGFLAHQLHILFRWRHKHRSFPPLLVETQLLNIIKIDAYYFLK